jgi:hypothetical protein
MDSLRKAVRTAGALYLLAVLTGPFVLLYVPGKLFVPGDAAATAANILTHEALFRAYIVVGLLSELIFIAVVLTLYRLLKGVNVELAVVMVILVLVIAPLAFVGTANDLATLAFVHGRDSLAAFAEPQRSAIATLLVNGDRHGVFVSEMFWGLWLFPLGLLVFRSGFMPRWLGVWLIINGCAYVITSLTAMLVPQYVGVVQRVSLPAELGEAALMLWLLVKGFATPAATVSA